MKTISTQQEILVLTGTSFSRRQWTEKNNYDKADQSEREELERDLLQNEFNLKIQPYNYRKELNELNIRYEATKQWNENFNKATLEALSKLATI